MTIKHDSANLDLLRAMAVLMVLAAHTLPVAFPKAGLRLGTTGHFGVLIFFVHTSLVLMFSMKRSAMQSGKLSFTEFYVRRAFRIYPLSIIVVILAVFTGFCTLSPGAVISNILLTMNFTGSNLAIVPLWSLPYEIDMYLALPFLFCFLDNQSIRYTLWLFMSVAVLAYYQPNISDRLDVLQYVGCFLPGIMAYQLSKQNPRFSLPWYIWPVLILGLCLTYSALSLTHPTRGYFIRWPVCLALGLLIPQFREVPNTLLRRISAVIAKYSYGIYLLHIFAVHIAFVVLASKPFLLQWLVFAVMVGGSAFVASRLVEEPGIAFGKRVVMRKVHVGIS